MQIALVGLGYVGLVSGVCLAGIGHDVIGYDIQPKKIDLINSSQAPVFEPELQHLLQSTVAVGTFRAKSNISETVTNAECILVCVGTPARSDGSADLTQLMNALQDIGEHLDKAADYPVIAIRSTVLPGTLHQCTEFLEMVSGLTAGQDFGIVSNPEFLREGSALEDFYHPSYIVVSDEDPRAVATMRKLYAGIDAPVRLGPSSSVEMLKYLSNAWHATKVAFANEAGALCKGCEIDGMQVMQMLCEDRKLNISSAYLTPGFAYGGSCLPKDLQALIHLAEEKGMDAPLLSQVVTSNAAHIQHSVRLIESTNNRKLGFLGLTFKENTDDLRESPTVVVVEMLLKKGYEIRVYDPNICRLNATFSGTGESLNWSPLLLDSVDEILAFGETIVVTRSDGSFNDLLDRIDDHHAVVDMTRLPGSGISGDRYHGICW